MVTRNAKKSEPDVDPHAAVESLRAALDDAGIVLPSLKVDPASPQLKLVELGRVRADVAMRLAEALRESRADSRTEAESAAC